MVAIDLSPTLVELARERAARAISARAAIDFRVGDMLDPGARPFDHVVAMDSLIHYDARRYRRARSPRSRRAPRGSMLFTFAPRTPALAVMHAVGRLFPRGDRAPAIEPVAQSDAARACSRRSRASAAGASARTQRIASGFYTSQALELVRA